MPEKTTSGDTSFAAYRMGGGVQQDQRGIVKPSKTVTIDGQKVAAKQTVASLPSNYKATEAEAFRKAAAFKEAQKIAKKNPNITVGVDSKGQPVAKAVQKGRGESGGDNTAKGNQARVQQNTRARAQAAAVNRKLSGRSISSVKAANKKAMQKKAEARHATFKKTKKSTVGQRRAAAKKAMQARAKKRHAAFKKRRKSKKKKCDIFLKYNISPLTNMNLIRDDLAEIAYFVKEIQS